MGLHIVDVYCPNCGTSFRDPKDFFADVYWRSEQSVCFYWCRNCKWAGEIVRIDKVITTEPDE